MDQELGSSPLTRGAPPGVPARPLRAGLIPAHAGSTAGKAGTATPAAAHPRSRGEHAPPKVDQRHIQGSSPLTRGAHRASRPQALVAGLIPAHAGSTSPNGPSTTALAAHPRSRGEHFGLLPDPRWAPGSSPLTRGARDTPMNSRDKVGLIPAHAGSTKHGKTSRTPPWAHPRSRGEHCFVDAGG